jgi:hypothetical protein
MKFLLKEVTDLTYLVLGTQAIDGFLNFKFSWKIISLNLSGSVLFVISIITTAEKFSIDFSVIKGALSNIPIFGVLPFGGLLHLGLFGLVGSLFFLSMDKSKRLEQISDSIQKKIDFWKAPIDKDKIQIKQIHFRKKISKLTEEKLSAEKQLQDGKIVECELEAKKEEKILIIHRKSLDDLAKIHDKIKNNLEKIEKRLHQWKHLDEIDLQSYQKAKENEWQTKLFKNEQEKKVNFLTKTARVLSISKNFYLVGSVTTGVGLAQLPLGLLGLALIACGLKITNVLLKRSVKKIKISPIKMENYIIKQKQD